MKKIEKICIGCPAGCHLEITIREDGSLHVAGNTCKRGIAYAENEMRDPRRVVTAVVHCSSKKLPYLPVRTDQALPVKLIEPLLRKLYSLNVCEPVRAGDILIHDFEGSKINVVFTRGIEP